MKNKGFTLIEVILVLVAVISLTVVAFAAYEKVQQNSLNHKQAEQIKEFRAGVEAIFPNKGYLGKLDTELALENGIIQEKNVWGGDIEVATFNYGPNRRGYMITLKSVPKEGCIYLATYFYDSAHEMLIRNTTMGGSYIKVAGAAFNDFHRNLDNYYCNEVTNNEILIGFK